MRVVSMGLPTVVASTNNNSQPIDPTEENEEEQNEEEQNEEEEG
jgi:hypothetical protein